MLFTADVLAKGAISQKYSVTYFSSQNGVEDGLVNDIIQDHKGLLWFATWNGLYRFDGYNFKNYKSNMEDLGGLTNDRLLDIVEDKFGCIWVLCYDSTCYRFNPDKEVFEPVIQKTVNNFRSISVLPNGIVWLLCEDGSAVRVVTAPEDLSMTFQFYSSRENTLATGKSGLYLWIRNYRNGFLRMRGYIDYMIQNFLLFLCLIVEKVRKYLFILQQSWKNIYI